MFILTTISDLIQIPPHEFYKRSRHEIEDKINEKYANKVVQKVGLCICMWDLLKTSDGLIGHGTGNVNVNVEFRLLVFRPFKQEIIAASVKSCTEEGIHVSTEFFEDIFVPKTMLFEGCKFHADEKTWSWQTDETEIWFDPGTKIHVRVENEKWEDLAPHRGPASNSAATATQQDEKNARDKAKGKGRVNGENRDDREGRGADDGEDLGRRKVPYYIEASISEPGLGGAEWW